MNDLTNANVTITFKGYRVGGLTLDAGLKGITSRIVDKLHTAVGVVPASRNNGVKRKRGVVREKKSNVGDDLRKETDRVQINQESGLQFNWNGMKFRKSGREDWVGVIWKQVEENVESEAFSVVSVYRVYDYNIKLFCKQ